MLNSRAHPIFGSTFRFPEWKAPPGTSSELGADGSEHSMTVKQRLAAGIAAQPLSSHGGYAGLHQQPPLYDTVCVQFAAPYPRKVSWGAVQHTFVLEYSLSSLTPP